MDHNNIEPQTNYRDSSNHSHFYSRAEITKVDSDEDYFASNERSTDHRLPNRNKKKDEIFIIEQKFFTKSLENTIKSFDRYFDQLIEMIPRRVLHWSVEDVGKWLSLIGLGVNFEKFVELSIDGSSIILLTEEDLIKEVGINSSITIGILMGWVTVGFEKYDRFLESMGFVIESIQITEQMRNRINQISFISNTSSVCSFKGQNRQISFQNKRTNSSLFNDNTSINELSFVSPMGKKAGEKLSSKKKFESKRLEILDKQTNICMSVNKFPFDLINELEKANKDHKAYYNQEKISFTFDGFQKSDGRRTKNFIKSLREELVTKNNSMSNWGQPLFYSQVNHENIFPEELTKIEISIEKDDKFGFNLQTILHSAYHPSRDFERKVFSQGQQSEFTDKLKILHKFSDEEVKKQDEYGFYCEMNEKETDGSEEENFSCPSGIRRKRNNFSSHMKLETSSRHKIQSGFKGNKCDLRWEQENNRNLTNNCLDVNAYILLKEAMEILKLPSIDPLYFTFQFVIDEFDFNGEFQQPNSFTLIVNNGKDKGVTKLEIIASNESWVSVFMICMDPFARKPILKELPLEQPISTWDENCRYAKMLSIAYFAEEEKFYLCKPSQLKNFIEAKHPIIFFHDENDKSEKSHGGIYHMEGQQNLLHDQKYMSNRIEYNINGEPTKKKFCEHENYQFRVWIKLPFYEENSLNFPPAINIRNGSAIKIGEREIVFTIHTTEMQTTKIKELRYGSYQEDSVFDTNKSQIQPNSEISDDLESVESNFNKCIICYEKPNNCIYLQCMHNVTCLSCGKVLESCPVCRQPIVDYLRLYTN